MNLEKPKEYQTIRLFAILGGLTLLLVLLFKVVLFAPQDHEQLRQPAESVLKIHTN
jgi:hypothetical protein